MTFLQNSVLKGKRGIEKNQNETDQLVYATKGSSDIKIKTVEVA